MGRVAVFVDAGYLFAQGSVALAGAKQSRSHLEINVSAVVAELTIVATQKSGRELLRIYWYDGQRSTAAMSLDHSNVAAADFEKLRLGIMNSEGHQKGVDSLIVTDLIELARNHAIDDALLVSGDEDVRVGVQIAQNYGVRVHLLGIHPARGSQAVRLLQEADTCTEWDATVVRRFLVFHEPVTTTIADTTSVSFPASDLDGRILAGLEAFVLNLEPKVRSELTTYYQHGSSVPADIDGRLLATCRTHCGRFLNDSEKREVRKLFKARIQSSLQPASLKPEA
jgi:uncharacterized LabA/DUF88 family protein